LGGIDTTQLRHREIEDHDVRFQFERLPHGLTAVGGFADHRPTGLRFEDLPQAFAHPRVIVREQDSHSGQQALSTVAVRS
jgi:hypothetical protein